MTSWLRHVIAFVHIVGAALGIVGFAVFWDGQTWFVVQKGAIGAAMSLILLTSAITFCGAFN